MATIWRNIAGRLGARTSRVAEWASDPAVEKFTFVEGACVTVVSFAAVSLLDYWIGFDRIRAERRALNKELKRTGGKVSVAFDKELERTEQDREVLKFIEWKFEREFQEWKAKRACYKEN